ncbi:ABC transporter substrate-binding protein, partial [Staphylococcus cohnii]|uniref:ABC transporter substrate-binding protein n=1 Tax=Staphylococcus cohnii TaxID=29382 RepID=UPI000D411598
LVDNTQKGIQPLLAKSWEVSEDGKTYTFHLREGVKFHDGTPFNAEAVKKNFDAVQANKSLHSWIKLSTIIDKTEVKDDHTFVLTLKEPYNATLEELAMTRPYVFVSPKAFKNGGTKEGLKTFSGKGPY